MGILNVTPDSFYDGGRSLEKGAVKRGLEMVDDGADWIDVGGESSRPGAEPVSLEEELKRVVPVVAELASRGVTVSVDTTKSEVARRSLEEGAEIINDISAFSMDPDMAAVCRDYGAASILMHMRGTPSTMQNNVEYVDLISEVCDFLESRLSYAVDNGIEREKTIVDPGIGFGKSREGNLDIIRNLSRFTALGRPILAGPSRKSFLGLAGAAQRLGGTLAASTVLIMNGADILRVHDVKEVRRAADMADALKEKG
ncbi:MAG: hypothetical protein BMS9Abin23_0438 [Thermodesulfobacteriota bacterium]|nr:MAG: hypothetical protein BMS9Abin23_0438 [Thermodesulfobacteriota bacterium]